MATLMALVALVLMVATALLVAVWLGTWAYVVWRTIKRQDLLDTTPIARAFFGPYESPFPWHRKAQAKDEKVA